MSWRMMRFWYSASLAAHAMLKRMSQNDEATVVFHECFRASCCDVRNSARTDSTPHNAVLDVFSHVNVAVNLPPPPPPGDPRERCVPNFPGALAPGVSTTPRDPRER